MKKDPISAELCLALAGASPEELEQITRIVRDELAEQPLENVDLVRGGAVPTGGKAADALTLGALVFVALPVVLPKVIEFLEHWALRKQALVIKLKLSHGDRSIELELPMSGDAPERLDAFVDRAKRAIAE